MRYLDREGLSRCGDALYLLALGVEYDQLLPDPLPTFHPLDTIITGPLSAHRWAYLPPYVQVEVVPDDISLLRVSPLVHSLRMRGLPTSYAKKAPGPKSKNYQSYLEAKQWAGKVETVVEMGKSEVPFEVVRDPQRAIEVINSLRNKLYVIDYETEGDRIEAAALADDKMSWLLRGNALRALPELRSLLVSTPGIAHSAIYEYEITAKNSLGTLEPTHMAPLYDTRVMHWLLTNKPGRNRLKPMVRELLRRDCLDFRDIVPRGSAIEDVPDGLLGQYAAAGDARNTYDLFNLLRERLEAEDLWDLYNTIERPLTPILAEMGMAGLEVSVQEVERLVVHYVKETKALEDALRYIGFRGQVSHPDDIARWFYGDLGIPIVQMTDSGSRGSVDKKVLELIKDKHPAVPVYMAHQKGTKLLQGFLLPMLSKGGSLRFSLQQTSTRTGRLSCSAEIDQEDNKTEGMNIQQLPLIVRKAIVAPEGQLFFVRDFSQIEPRIMAEMSQDPTMVEAYKRGEDLYLSVGARLGKKDPKSIRQDLKVYFLASVYGDYNKYSQQILRTFPVLDGFRQQVIKEVREHGAVYSMAGRRRVIPQISSRDPATKHKAEREAVNAVIQMTGADLMKLAMLPSHPFIKSLGGMMRETVHDELGGTWPIEAERYSAELDELMTTNPYVRLKVEGKSGRSWGDAK